MRCQRCGQNTVPWTISIFDSTKICVQCKRKEKDHPKYKEAIEIGMQHIKAKKYNFAGIGKPQDL